MKILVVLLFLDIFMILKNLLKEFSTFYTLTFVVSNENILTGILSLIKKIEYIYEHTCTCKCSPMHHICSSTDSLEGSH